MMATYLERTQPKPMAIQPVVAAKVIRSQPPPTVGEQVTVVTSPKKAAITRDLKPLNLKLPSLENIQRQYVESNSSVLNLFEKEAGKDITYNAELVFDAASGEDITGGKVNIKIPFG